jgi:hypothetical protein
MAASPCPHVQTGDVSEQVDAIGDCRSSQSEIDLSFGKNGPSLVVFSFLNKLPRGRIIV